MENWNIERENERCRHIKTLLEGGTVDQTEEIVVFSMFKHISVPFKTIQV